MASRYCTDAEILAVAPGFSSVDSVVRDLYRELAEECVSLGVYGARASQYHAHLAAHLLGMSPHGVGVAGASPAVSSRAMGPVSASYAVPTVDVAEAELSSTSWGRICLLIRRGTAVMPLVATSEPEVVG